MDFFFLLFGLHTLCLKRVILLPRFKNLVVHIKKSRFLVSLEKWTVWPLGISISEKRLWLGQAGGCPVVGGALSQLPTGLSTSTMGPLVPK